MTSISKRSTSSNDHHRTQLLFQRNYNVLMAKLWSLVMGLILVSLVVIYLAGNLPDGRRGPLRAARSKRLRFKRVRATETVASATTGGVNSNNFRSFYNTSNYPYTNATGHDHYGHRQHHHHHHQYRQKQRRIAIILPFAGQGPPDIPSYLNLFCLGAAAAAPVADFFIIHNGVLAPPTPLQSHTTTKSTTRAAEDSSTSKSGGQSQHAQNVGEDEDSNDESNRNSNTSPLFDCPPNVIWINLGSTLAMADHLVRVVDHKAPSQLASAFTTGIAASGSGGDASQAAAKLARHRLVQLVARHLQIYPYCLVEFKPALGFIFQEYITGYSHWGYSDLDMLYGDLARWMSPEEWTDFDIVTYGFGDQHRLYLRGQFTMHRNDPLHINQLWRACDYLSNLDERLAAVVNGKAPYKFESAEGCYSAAILQVPDIKVKFATKAWTDIREDDAAYTHGIYLSRNVQTGQMVISKRLHASSSSSSQLSPTWFLEDPLYSDLTRPMQTYVGEMQPLELPNYNSTNHNNVKCMYWVQPKYQKHICLPEHTMLTNQTLYWIRGRLYQQSHVNAQPATATNFAVTTAPFFHFQEWKRYYRPGQVAALRSSSPLSQFVLVKEGAIPMIAPSKDATSFVTADAQAADGPDTAAVVTYQHWLDSASPLGGWHKAFHSVVSPSVPKRRKHGLAFWNRGFRRTNNDNNKNEGEHLRHHHSSAAHIPFPLSALPPSSRSYCLVSGPRKIPPQPPAPQCYQMVSWQDARHSYSPTSSQSVSAADSSRRSGGPSSSSSSRERLVILSRAPEWQMIADADEEDSTAFSSNLVTLVLTLQITSGQARDRHALSDLVDEMVVANLEQWQGQPSVVVIHVAGVTTSEEGKEGDEQQQQGSSRALEFLQGRFQSDVSFDNALIAVVLSEQVDTISRKALLNMAIDAVPTRWYVSGLELERGFVLSRDSVVFAHRAVQVYNAAGSTGTVLWIPQFALVEGASVLKKPEGHLGVRDLILARERKELKRPFEVEHDTCDDGDMLAQMDLPEQLWWDQIKILTGYNKDAADFTNMFEERAEALIDMEVSFMELLTNEQHLKMFALDESPILMIDNLGPHYGMRTDELVREVEELGGRRCYNGLRLSQLATMGYRFDVLGGAFAVSTAETRRASAWGVEDEASLSLPGSSRCDGCFMFADEHEDILEDIVKDEIRRPSKLAVLWAEATKSQ